MNPSVLKVIEEKARCAFSSYRGHANRAAEIRGSLTFQEEKAHEYRLEYLELKAFLNKHGVAFDLEEEAGQVSQAKPSETGPLVIDGEEILDIQGED